MSALSRGRCPVCRQDVALRSNGTTREHFDGYLPQGEQRPELTNGRMKKCEGSGQPRVKCFAGHAAWTGFICLDCGRDVRNAAVPA